MSHFLAFRGHDGFHRRQFLYSAATVLLGSCSLVRADDFQAETPATRRGLKFLVELFDDQVDLLPEFQGSTTYWLYHDNFLAARLLEKERPELARKIDQAIEKWGVKRSGKIEILFQNDATAPPFHHHELLEVGRVGNRQIKTEQVTDRLNEGWGEYADLRFLATISLASRNLELAKLQFEAGMKMWDGKGFADKVQALSGLYATYKLALALLAAKRIGSMAKELEPILARLQPLQNEHGGWITDYDASLKPRGLSNVETTCLALMAVA